ncbi:MAG: hypothetical protein ABIQ64_02570 [Candidatus Saccharimonadales bacterium]
MGATTLPSLNLIDKLSSDFPQFIFKNAHASRWSPQEKTVYYHDAVSTHGQYELLHELGHALLDHDSYTHDVELLSIEREAWDKAVELAPSYGLAIDDDAVEEQLDTYRNWLHARSRCPNCHVAGFQQTTRNYNCLLCGVSWRANEAKHCGLRRYTQ